MEPILVIMAVGMGSRYGGNKQLDKITEQGVPIGAPCFMFVSAIM